MLKNRLLEVAMRLMFYGAFIIDTYAKSKMIIDDVYRMFDRMHAHTM
jgi:pentatricopeptide repeat protein